MTSSLVGSEMCIRDRGGRERGEGGRERERERETGRDGGGGGVGGGDRAVSYTHLTLPTICSV
eukprot:4207537-Prorocentrum_lima.AAC.1